MSWQAENEGPEWMPLLNAAEVKYGIPTNLLARIAYQESHFRNDIITGITVSPAGAVGLMQLMPRFFPGAGQSAPNDINTAGALLASLYRTFHDWQIAVAAYNWGQGDVEHEYVKDHAKYVLADMPKETQDYVTDVCGDVGIPGALIPSVSGSQNV